MALTERQQEIKTLLDQGKTPREVGEALGISENAVYQHRRRMQGKSTKASTTTRRRGSAKRADEGTRVRAEAARSTARKSSGRKRSQRTSTQRHLTAVQATPEPQPMDPLTAVRHRRDALNEQVAQTKASLDEIAKLHQEAQKAHDTAVSKVKTELDQLAAAEALLTGKLKPPERRPRKAEAKPEPETAPAPEPEPEVTTPPMPEADAQDDAAEAPDEPTEVPANGQPEEERPGVPTLSEFKQEDAFTG